ncbi:FUSC family protein [Streptomyces daliensis]|uniref:FUSC family protein n=1 Tax=Streptomyces daliensis TaxID=299421 RepID=A0A8T4IPR2_9ACTN|nr:FUSC family protein [Streptomyces daliensis]
MSASGTSPHDDDSDQHDGASSRGAAGRAVERARQWLSRARGHAGHERHIALLLAKSALAGVVSWTLAEYVVASPQPTYAPFTALLVVQSTVYRTLVQSGQYVGAVLLGVLAAGAVGPLLGDNVAAFAVMLVIGLLIGRWHKLGVQGIQVPVAGVFAYNAFSGTELTMLWPIVSMVLLGAATGLVVNLVLLPPMHYGTAAEGVRELSTSVCSVLTDMASGLREGPPEKDTAAEWARRARELDGTVRKARYAVEHGAESISYNPRRLLSRSAPTTFSGYRTMVDSLARAAEQVRSISFGLQRSLEEERPPDDGFLRAYGEFLDLVAETAQRLGDPEAGDEDLRRRVENGREHYDELVRRTGENDAWPTLGALLIDAHRLLQEFAHAHGEGAVRPE